METRKLKRVAAPALLVFAAVVLIFLPIWRCPVWEVFGICCPGCGMSRAFRALLCMDLYTSLYYHALAIPTLLSGILIGICLQKNKKDWARSLLILWIAGMILYWVYRLVFVFSSTPDFINPSPLILRVFSWMK